MEEIIIKRPSIKDNLSEKDLKEMKDFLEENLNNIEKEGYPLKDFEHYCYEMLIQAFYGSDIWRWLRENKK